MSVHVSGHHCVSRRRMFLGPIAWDKQSPRQWVQMTPQQCVVLHGSTYILCAGCIQAAPVSETPLTAVTSADLSHASGRLLLSVLRSCC